MTLEVLLALVAGIAAIAFAVWGFLRIPPNGQVEADASSAGVRDPVRAMPEVFGTGAPDFGPPPPAATLEPEAHREEVEG